MLSLLMMKLKSRYCISVLTYRVRNRPRQVVQEKRATHGIRSGKAGYCLSLAAITVLLAS